MAENRKARHDYNIEDTIEAGIALQTEIKSIRRGSANLKDSYAQVKRGEMYINNMHIAPYEEGNRFNHDPLFESCYCIKRDYQTRRTYKRNWIFDYSFKIVFKTWTM